MQPPERLGADSPEDTAAPRESLHSEANQQSTVPDDTGGPRDPEDATRSGGPHVCANCFADFDWEPAIHEGEEYCCPGCAQGGPCICTYSGAPAAPPVERDSAPDDSPEPEQAGLTAPAFDVVMGAVSEMPVAIRAVVILRLTRDISAEEIAEELRLSREQVEERLSQAQAILDRTVGPGFPLDYTPESARITPGPEPGPPPPPAEPPDRLVADSLGALAAPLLGRTADSGETAEAQGTIREALRDASEIFRLAASRLEEEDGDGYPLRRMLMDEPANEVMVIAEELEEPADFLAILDGLAEVRWVRVEEVTDEGVIYKVETGSVSALVRGLLSMEPEYRPQRLRVLGDVIRVVLPSFGEPAGVREAGPIARRGGPVFELGADAFFGARHFVTMNGVPGPPHHHSYRVEVIMQSPAQDEDGIVIGFGDVRSLIEAILKDYNETLLNTVAPFTEIPPTSENLARVIFERLASQFVESDVAVKQVRVWESPTNSASYSDAALTAH